MKINAVCLVACLLASVAPAASAEQHLVDSPVLMKILKTVDEAPTDEHLLDVTLRLLKGICECMTETLLVKQERTSHADTSIIPSATWMDDGAARNTSWKELELYQKIYNNTCFNLRNELAVKVDVEQLERTKNENDTQSSFSTWNCGKQHEITTERIVKASTSMAPVLDDSLRYQLDNILFKTLIVTKDFHTYKLRRRNLFGRTIPVTRNKKKHSIIVIVTLHPPQIMTRNRKLASENVGSLSDVKEDKFDEIELNRTIHSKSAVDIDIFDTDFNPTEKESDENNKNMVSKCVLLSIYKFLTESESNNNTKVFKLLRRKKSIKIYIEIMASQGDKNYSGMCCDGDAITTSCKQQYIAKHLSKDESQDNVQNKLKQKPIPIIEETNSDYKDTIAKIKNLLKLYDNELQKSTYYGKKGIVDNKLEGPKHGGHVGSDAHANVIDVFPKHNNVADQVTKSTNSDKVEYTTQIFSTIAPTTQGIYTFKGFYDDELWDNTIPQQSKSTVSTINFSNHGIINEFQNSVPTTSNIYFLNIKKDPLKKAYIVNTIKRDHVLSKVRTTRSAAIKETQSELASETEKLADTIINTNRRSTDQVHETLNPYAVLPLNYDLVGFAKQQYPLSKTTDVKASTEYSKDNKVISVAKLEADNEKSNKIGAATNMHLNDKINAITSLTNNNNFVSKVPDSETETENIVMTFREHKTGSDIFESFTEEDKTSTQTPTITTQQKTVDNDSLYLLQTTESLNIKQNDFNERIYESTISSDYETSTTFNDSDTDHNSEEYIDSNEKYKHAIINSIIESIHPQQFTDYKNIDDTTTDTIISKESSVFNNSITITNSPDLQMDSTSIATMKSSAEYVEYSSESGENRVNNSIQIHSTYDENKHLSLNLLKPLIPLEPFVTSNNFIENVHFTTEYETLAGKATESSVKFSGRLENVDVSEKYETRLTNLTGSSLSLHNTIENESEDRHRSSDNAQELKSSVSKNMNAITEVVDNYLSTTEDVIALSTVSENYVTPNPTHYIKTDFEYATIPGTTESDKDNVFKVNTDQMFHSYVDTYGNKELFVESENLKNGADGTVSETKNKIALHLTEKGYIDVMESTTSNTEYTNVEQMESIIVPGGISESSSSNYIIEEKSETISPSTENDEIPMNNEVINKDNSRNTSDNDITIATKVNINEDKLATTIDTTITAEKPEIATEIIRISTDDENMNEENSYDTTATMLANTDSPMQRTEPSSVISIEDVEMDNLEEHFATTLQNAPEKIRDENQLDYSEQTTDREMDNAFVNAPVSYTPAPMSLKKVEPLVIDRESSQIVESSMEEFDQRLDAYTPIIPTNVQPLLKNINWKPINDLASASEEVIVVSEKDVQASEYHISTPTSSINVKPLVYTERKDLSELKVTTGTSSMGPFIKLTSATASIAATNSKHPRTDGDESKYVNETIRITTEDTGGSQIYTSATEEVLVNIESGQKSKTDKSTPISKRIDLLVTSIGKYIEKSRSASDQYATTMLERTKSKTLIETQDLTSSNSRASTTHYNTKEYVDYSAESVEKHTNKSYGILSTYENLKHTSVKVNESLTPIEPTTISNNFTSNVNFTTKHQNLKAIESGYSVKFSAHLENTDSNKKISKNVSGASIYIPNTKDNKSQDLSKNLQAVISATTKNIDTKKSRASQQVSELDVSSQNIEPLIIHREGKPIDSTEYKLIVTDKVIAQDPETYTVASNLSTYVEYLGIHKERKQHNTFLSVNDEVPVINASMFQLPMNIVPLLTSTTDKIVNGSISATSMNVTLNDEDLVQALKSRTEDNIHTIHPIEMNSALEKNQANRNKDFVESVLEKLTGTDTTRLSRIDETSAITFQGMDTNSTLIYTQAAFLYTTTNNSVESTTTSVITSTQTAMSPNGIVTKNYPATGEQIDKTQDKALNSSNKKSTVKGNLTTSTIKSDAVTEYYHTKQYNSTVKNLESDIEETLFNEIEKEESAENDKKIKGNLNQKTFDQQPATTLRNTNDELYTISKFNLETSTDILPSVKTILLNRAESVGLDSQEDNSVETSTLSSLSESMSSMENTVTKLKLQKSLLKLQDDVLNEKRASRISNTSKLVTDAPNLSEITPTHTLENIHISKSDKTANDIAAPILNLRPSLQKPSFHDFKHNVTNVIVEKTRSTLSSDNKARTDNYGVIIPITKSRELKEIYISDDISTKKLTYNDSTIPIINIPRPTLQTHNKKQENENDGNIINQEKKKDGGREFFSQNVRVNNSHGELPQKLHQTPQKYLLFIKNSQNTEIKTETNFYPQDYNRTSLKHDTTAETIILQLRSTPSTPSAQKNSVINEFTTTLRNDGLNEQDSRTNANPENGENKSEYTKFEDQDGGEMNALTTLNSKQITIGVITDVTESTTLTKGNEHTFPKDDIEQKSGTKIEIQSKENKLEYTESKYQDVKMLNDEPTVVPETNSSTTKENNLINIKTYSTTVISDINKITKLVQGDNGARPNNVLEQFRGTKEKLDNTENTSYANTISTLIPLIISGGTSTIMGENLSEMETWNSPQFQFPENLKGNAMTTNKQATFKNKIKQDSKTKSDIESYENKSEYTKLNHQINETHLALHTLSPEDIRAEVNLETNKITTLANNNEQRALNYHFEQNGETKADLEIKLNKFEFTDITDQDDKYHISFTNTPEVIATVVNSDINEITTFRKDVSPSLRDYNQQNTEMQVEFEAKENKFQIKDFKNEISETVNEISTSTAKKTTASISSQVKSLPKMETTINIVTETIVPHNYEFTLPLLVTEDIRNALSTSTLEETKLGVNYEVDEFTTLSKEIKSAVEKDRIEQNIINKEKLQTHVNRSQYTELKVTEVTNSINEHEEPVLNSYIRQDSVTKAEVKAREYKYNSKYTEFKNQESGKADDTSIEKENTVSISAEIVDNLTKIETTTIVVPEGIYLPNNYKFTLPNLYSATPDEMKKELYSKVSQSITLKNDHTSSEDDLEYDAEIKFKLKVNENKSIKNTKLNIEQNGKMTETSIFAPKTVTAGILTTAQKYLPNIETGIDITDETNYDKFTFPLLLAVTEDITNTISTLNQEDIKLEINPEVNVINTWRNETYLTKPNDHTEQDKSELNFQENEILNSISTFSPEEIKAEMELNVNKITIVANGNQQPTQQDQIKLDLKNRANLETKENKSKYTELKNRQDEKSNEISTSIAKQTTHTFTTVVENLYTTEITKDVLSTGIQNLAVLNNSDFTRPLVATEDIITSKIMEEGTDVKITSVTEQINQGNVLHNSPVGNNTPVNDIEVSSKSKYITQGDFTAVNRMKPTHSIDIGEKDQNIGSFTLDYYNKQNHEISKNITENRKQPFDEINVSNTKVNLHFLSAQTGISFATLNSNNNNVVTPAGIKEEVIIEINTDNENNKLKEMSTIGLHETLPKLIEDEDNITLKSTNFILMNKSVSNQIETLNTMSVETASNKKSVEELLISTKATSKEKNADIFVNGEVNILRTESTTIERENFTRETVPQIISKEASFTFNNFVRPPPMLENSQGTVPEITTLLGEEIIKNVKDEKESFTMTLPKPQLERIKMTNRTIHEHRTYDFDKKISLNGEDNHIITKDFLKIASTNIDFDDKMKKYKVSISALKQKIVHENGTNSTTTINRAEESVVFTDSLELPEEQLLQNTDIDDIETNNVIKKPNITTVGSIYPSLIYSPVSYLDQRLFTENNNLASNHDGLLPDTNDSLQKKYSKEADEVLSELAAVLTSNCNNKNKVSPSEMCYSNVLARIAQNNNNLPTDDPAISKSRQVNISENETTPTPAVENISSAAQKKSPEVEKIMSTGFSNLTHSNSHMSEVNISKLTTYAIEAKSNKNSSEYDINQTERNESLHVTVPDRNSSLHSESTKEDDAFKKAIIIASAFKNLDFLFKKSKEDTSLEKQSKSMKTESSPLKVQFPTTAVADKASKDSHNVATVPNNKYNSLHLNDSKIYYIPFISNAAVNKHFSETSSNMTDYVANSLKQELALANLNIDNETSNTMNTSKNLDPKDHKIKSISIALNSNIKPKDNKINENSYIPIESTQVSSINEPKNVNIKSKENEVISKPNPSEEFTSNETKEYNNKIIKSVPTLDKTFNNSMLGLTYANLSSPQWKYESVENVNHVDFQEKRDLLKDFSQSGDIINQNMSYNAHLGTINKYSKYDSFNATESLINDSIDLKGDKSVNMSEVSPSTFEVSSTIKNNTFESSENNFVQSKVTNLKTSLTMNKITRALTKDKKIDRYRSNKNINEDGFQNFNNTSKRYESTIGKYVTPIVSHRSTHQLFAKSLLSNELNGSDTSQAPVFSILPDRVSTGSVNFPSSAKAANEVKTLLNAETKKPYLLQTKVQVLWNSLQDMIDTSSDHDVNTIQTGQSLSNTLTANTIFHTGKSVLPAAGADVNKLSKTSNTEDIDKLRRNSYKQMSEDFGKNKTLKHLFTNDEITLKTSAEQITKGYVPIMTFTDPSKNVLITKAVLNIIKKNNTNIPSSTIGYNLYTNKINSQTVDTEPKQRNHKTSASNYIPYSKKFIRKSTPSGANIEGYIVSKLIHLVPEIVEKVTNYDNIPSNAPDIDRTVIKPILNVENMHNGKSNTFHILSNTYSTKLSNKEMVETSTPKIVNSLVGNNNYEHSAMVNDMLRLFLQPTQSYPNIQPNIATEQNTVESISYSTLPNITVMRSTKKMKRHRNTKYPNTDDTTTTAPRKSTVRKKRRRTSKRIVYNTYEPTMYEDLEIDFTDKLGKKGTQVKPTRANGEEILGELMKSSDHVHIGDATAILPWPVYFPTPSTTRQVNVRGKIELSHIVRQKTLKNNENASNKSMNSVGNIEIKTPTRLPVFNTFYRKHMDATEKMTSLSEPHITSVPVFVSFKGHKPNRLVNLNHYEMVITTEPTRWLEKKIQNNVEIIPVQSKQIMYRNGPSRNAFTSTLLPPETPKSRRHNIHRSVTRKVAKNLSFYQGLGKIYEKPTHFPIFGDVYKYAADTIKNVRSTAVHDNFIKTATNENNIAVDKATAFMKATHSSNMKILLFRRNDPRVSKINQFQTRKVMGDITYSPNAKRGPTARFAIKQFQLGKKNNSKMRMGGKKSLRNNKFLISKVDVASTTDTNVDFTLKDFITSNVRKSTEIIKNVISKSQRIKGMLFDPLDPRVKTKLYPVKIVPKYKIKKVHLSVDDNNMRTVKPKELILNNINRKLDNARKKFFDELARTNMKTYIVHSAKPSLSRQILLRPKFESIDNARITQVPPIEPTEKDTRPNLIAIDFLENRMPIAFNLMQTNNKHQLKALAPNTRENRFNVLENPLYFPIMNRKSRVNLESKYGMSTRGFLVPEEKYFLESPAESFREAPVAMPPPAPSTSHQMHVTPLKPRRSRRTIFFLSPTASYIEYF